MLFGYFYSTFFYEVKKLLTFLICRNTLHIDIRTIRCTHYNDTLLWFTYKLSTGPAIECICHFWKKRFNHLCSVTRWLIIQEKWYRYHKSKFFIYQMRKLSRIPISTLILIVEIMIAIFAGLLNGIQHDITDGFLQRVIFICRI